MVFTLFLWAAMLLIFFSSKGSKTNQWCAFSIFIFSLGTLKEFLYYDLPSLSMINNGVQLPYKISTSTYSVMTAVLYYWVLPCCMIFSLYFSNFFNYKSKRNILLIKLSAFLPSVVLFLCFTPTKTAMYQNSSMIFWYVVSIYNFCYGLIMSIIMIFSAVSEKTPVRKRQKRFISLIILPPIWYWLVTIFLVHSLKIALLYKVWKDNIFILSLSIIAYVGLACTEGMMGLKLQSDHYHWDSEIRMASKNVRYTVHMLKNQINKMEWCINNINKSEEFNDVEEIKIIDRSVNYMKDFINKTQLYAGDVKLNFQKCSLSNIIENAITSFESSKESNINIDYHTETDVNLYCDTTHLTEVFYNFICNASESMNYHGMISIELNSKAKKNMCLITISDEGCGISKQNLPKLFNPYFTTKETNGHFGLGLTYCYNVIKKHKGYIDVKSKEGKGTNFYIYLPFVSFDGGNYV